MPLEDDEHAAWDAAEFAGIGMRMSGMQFGIFTVGDVTADPTTRTTPTEAARIKATVQIAMKAEEVGLDVFATGSTTIRHSSHPRRLGCSALSQRGPNG